MMHLNQSGVGVMGGPVMSSPCVMSSNCDVITLCDVIIDIEYTNVILYIYDVIKL